MPSKTKKQARFMAACSDKAFRAKSTVACPPLSVAKEFTRADARKKRKRR